MPSDISKQAIVPGGRGGMLRPVRTTEEARALAEKRWQKKAAAIRRGVAKAGEQLPDVESSDPYAVLEYAAEQHAMAAVDPSAKGSQQSLRTLLREGWPAPPVEANPQGPALPPGPSVILTPGAMEVLLRRMAEIRAQEAETAHAGAVVDGIARPVEGGDMA